jgi:hypothetical protein
MTVFGVAMALDPLPKRPGESLGDPGEGRLRYYAGARRPLSQTYRRML